MAMNDETFDEHEAETIAANSKLNKRKAHPVVATTVRFVKG